MFPGRGARGKWQKSENSSHCLLRAIHYRGATPACHPPPAPYVFRPSCLIANHEHDPAHCSCQPSPRPRHGCRPRLLSGHLGLPLGCAEIGAVLFGQPCVTTRTSPKWLNRDRFILSAGHGSMFLYSLAASVAATTLPIERGRRISASSQSHTPGHPESFETAGRGIHHRPARPGRRQCRGLRLSRQDGRGEVQHRRAHDFRQSRHRPRRRRLPAGRRGHGGRRLRRPCQASTTSSSSTTPTTSRSTRWPKVTQSEDAAKHFTPSAGTSQTIDGHDIAAIVTAFDEREGGTSGKPKLIIAKTLIGKGIPEVAGTAKAHGEGGAKFVDEAARAALGLPADEHFFVSDEVKRVSSPRSKEELARRPTPPGEDLRCVGAPPIPELAAELDRRASRTRCRSDLTRSIPEFPADCKDRHPQRRQRRAQRRGQGHAELHHRQRRPLRLDARTTSRTAATSPRTTRGPQHLVRHPRARACARSATASPTTASSVASGATFLVFADYCRPSIRLAALSQAAGDLHLHARLRRRG